MIKAIIYCAVVPLVIWALESININNIFKKNRYYQARLCYLILVIALSYLIVNFFFDFYNSIKFI